MFAKLCNWLMTASLACVLSACGGGEPDNASSAGPVVLAAAAGGQAGDERAASGYGAFANPAADQQTAQQQAGQAAAGIQASSAQDGAPNMSFQAQFQMFTMHGGAAYAIQDAVRARLAAAAAARVLESRQTNPEIADDAARDRMALEEVEFEKSFSLEKNRELAERKAREGIVEPVVQQAYVPFEDCLDARLPGCSGNPRLAHN